VAFAVGDGEGGGLGEGLCARVKGEEVASGAADRDGDGRDSALAWLVGEEGGCEARELIPARRRRKPNAMTGSFHAAPVRSPGIHQIPAGHGLRIGDLTDATHWVPFHLHRPSGDSVDSHVWPSQNHCPSGEICPFWSTNTFPSKSAPSG
jgi:hypothetical protein